ncbi:MAG: YdcF family protein, partial [Clostridia bacterium]|nr:YdcF family protein [Clostridia bacterium]
MNNRIITDISDYIFISDEPEKVDAIFLPGGSHPEQPEYAAELYKKGLAKWLVASGGVSVKRDKWPGVRSKKEIYNGDYNSDFEFFTDVFLKNGVPVSAIIGEDKSGHTRDNAFMSRIAVDEKNIEI